MSRRHSRFLGMIVGILLATAAPRTAFASAPWSADCNYNWSANRVCIFSDWHFEGNRGNMAGSNYDYAGEDYPSSTNDVNDSISSMKNLYSGSRVRWWDGPQNTFYYYCSVSNSAVWEMSFLYNDHFSSHEVTGAAC